MTRNRLFLAAASIAIAAQAQAAHARVTYICPELHGSELKVRVDSGCMSSSTSYQSDNLALEVDQSRAVINITGTMTFGGGGRIVTADCMGAKSVTLTAQDIEPRRYTVLHNGERVGLADFNERRKSDQCLPGKASKRYALQREEIILRHSAYRDWNRNPASGWRDWRSESVLGLLAPVLNGHPETLEGRPVVDIDIRRATWRREFKGFDAPNWREPFIAVTVTHQGYLDDSVSGGRYFAEVRQDETGQWKLDGFWSQNMCARGQFAGQWTSERCL